MNRKSAIRNITKRLSALSIALMLFGMHLVAQVKSIYQTNNRQAVTLDCDTALTSDLRQILRHYNLSDNLFWGFNVTGGRILSPEGNMQDMLTMVRPGGDIVFGKFFNPLLSASLNLSYAMQQECLPPYNNPTIAFHSAALSIEAQLCFNNMLSRQNYDDKLLLYGVAGAGLQAAFSFDKVDALLTPYITAGSYFTPRLHTGIMLEGRISDAVSLTMRGIWGCNTSSPCGRSDNHFHQRLEASMGFMFRVPNRYGARSFQFCHGNEIYYFNELEDHLLKSHQRQLKQSLKGKAQAPVLAAEQDSIIIFPCGYAYLTKRQEAKLDIVARQLALNPQLVLTVDLYPIVADDPKMTPLQSVQRCEVTLQHYLTKHHSYSVDPKQLIFRQHPDRLSPYANQSIWIHGAILHYSQQ